jgi:stage II sporulation protein M
MKKLQLQLHRMSVIQVAGILLILGLFFGVFCANVFRENYTEQLQNYEVNVFSKISGNDIDYSGLFRYVLAKNYNDFIVFWLLCITILGIPYMALKVASFGFFTGFFISAVTIQFGFKGLLLVLVYAFPHGLIYLPIAFICLYKGMELYRSIYHENRAQIGGIVKILKSYLIVLLLLAVALLIGSFLEAYVGAFLLKKTLGLF